MAPDGVPRPDGPTYYYPKNQAQYDGQRNDQVKIWNNARMLEVRVDGAVQLEGTPRQNKTEVPSEMPEGGLSSPIRSGSIGRVKGQGKG